MKKPDDLLQLWIQLLRTHHECVQAVNAIVSRAGISLATYEILYRLSQAQQRRLRMQALATTLLLSSSGLSRAVEKGEHLGLLAREQDGVDERGRVCVLTAKGSELLKQVQPKFFGALDHIFGTALTVQEVQTAVILLSKIQIDTSASN